MGDDLKPEKDPKAKKRGKKLELNKETIQELSDEQLESVAGGATSGARCKTQTAAPACVRSVDIDCGPGTPDPTAVACPPPLTMGANTCDICPLTG